MLSFRSQQCDERVHVLAARRPRGADAHNRVGIVELLRKAHCDLPLQLFDLRIFQHDEDLVRRVLAKEAIALLTQRRADAIRRLDGVAADLLIKSVGEERIELYAEKPSLGEQRAVLLDDGEECSCTVEKHKAKQG